MFPCRTRIHFFVAKSNLPRNPGRTEICHSQRAPRMSDNSLDSFTTADTIQSLIPLPEDLPFKVRGGTPDAMKTPSKLAYLKVLQDGDAIWTSPPLSRRQWVSFIKEESLANFVGSQTMAESLEEKADLLAKDDENRLQRTPLPRRATFPIEKEQLGSAKKSLSPPVFRYKGDDCNVNVCIVKAVGADTQEKHPQKETRVFNSSRSS
ncbi:hypothetical protein RvY_18657 [Ramazzottius varieornatus]|uniref:Uncharacterized protein n=1 Tax=Ramazzottius varieornatus TaxID=947166 RepID=A0A1D1W6L0_RAMVA|nr:hypothetical protein RvY_18657 [Ramazzottius varieornatus]